MKSRMKSLESIDEFYVGQRVKITKQGEAAFPRRRAREGFITRIHDLSCCIRPNDPHARPYSLIVLLDGNKTPQIGGNAIYWTPIS